MKYRVSNLPNTAHALRFKVQTNPTAKESVFSISRSMIETWGYPLEPKLKRLMVAYIKKNGWSSTPVDMNSKNSPRDLEYFILSLASAKK